jgi:CBS domain-containing protein
MLLRDILQNKGAKVFTIGPEATLADVVDRLVEHNCGSLLVCHAGEPCKMLGIISERDILRACAATRLRLEEQIVADRMTREVVTAGLDQPVEDAMGLMTTNRIRHLPIIEGGELVGIISIGDVVKAQHDALTMENHYLKNYIHG